MMRSFLFSLSALALTACAGDGFRADVVRFHNQYQAAPQSVALKPADPALAGSLEFAAYANRLGEKLGKLGFRPAASAPGADLVGEISYGQVRRSGPRERSPFSIGVGVGGGGGNVGGAVSTSIGLGKGSSRDIVASRLELKLKRASDGQTVWEGRAETQARADSKGAGLAEAMPGLIDALLSQFPGPAGVTTTYKE